MKWSETSLSLVYGDTGDWLCAREALEFGIDNCPNSLLLDQDYWHEVIVLARESKDSPAVFRQFGGVNLRDPPEGTSWLRWAEWVERRFTEAVDDPGTVLHRVLKYPGQYQWRYRSSVVRDEGRSAVDRLLEMHESLLEGWVGAGEGSARLHLVGDVGHEVGSVLRLDGSSVASVASTSRAGVVVQRAGAEGLRVVGVHAGEPEPDPREAGWRDRWPALVVALGGWLGDASVGSNPWVAQDHLLRGESDEFLARVAHEGGEVLELGDGDLRAAVVALGGAVEPPHLRWWLQWMVWRIGAFDWKQP